MFDEDEINILLDALSVWENKPSEDVVMSGLIGAIFSKDAEKYAKKKQNKNSMMQKARLICARKTPS